MRVREYNIISHNKLPEYHKRTERNYPLLNNDKEYLTMKRTLSQNHFSRTGKSSNVFPTLKKADLKIPFEETKEIMRQQKKFSVNYQCTKFWDEMNYGNKPR
jgi:hypothetical protein